MIEEDIPKYNSYIGCGRFRIDLYSENWNRYEDNSGGHMYLTRCEQEIPHFYKWWDELR